MTQLYSSLAKIYHEMYQHIFNYDEEFDFYDSILKKNGCTRILEVGCGSGMLARRFLKNGYNYLGLDLFNEMLDIARTEVPAGTFVQCDMRNLPFSGQFDAVLITGRSISYVTENRGIIDTLAGVYKSLKNNGLFVFGVFEANGIFNNLTDFEQVIEHNNKRIQRTSKLTMNLETGWTYDWYAKYMIEENGEVAEYDDYTTLRAFTKDEILLFLKLAGFEVLEILDEAKTMTFIARKF
ncbi:MAG: class I SAM-dependent methyltransferase [Bacteroidetes bacterium]|nr:class I SAM-dependent methyltransferase [Bacteroidota bacterium]